MSRRRCCCAVGNCSYCTNIGQWEVTISGVGGWWSSGLCAAITGTFLLDYLRTTTDYGGPGGPDACIWRYEYPSPVGNYAAPLIYGITLILTSTDDVILGFDFGDIEGGVPQIYEECWMTDFSLPDVCDCPDDYDVGHLGNGFGWYGYYDEGFVGQGCYESWNCVAILEGDDNDPTHNITISIIPP